MNIIKKILLNEIILFVFLFNSFMFFIVRANDGSADFKRMRVASFIILAFAIIQISYMIWSRVKKKK